MTSQSVTGSFKQTDRPESTGAKCAVRQQVTGEKSEADEETHARIIFY